MTVSRRPGAVLLEMVIALALFVAGAALLSQLHSSVAQSLERSRLSLEAADLARTTLAELEAGIITLADVRTVQLRTEQSRERMERRIDADDLEQPSPWQLSVNTERSPYEGLTLVELTVAHMGDSGGASEARRFDASDDVESTMASVTIRQLMRLREDVQDESSGARDDAEAGF